MTNPVGYAYVLVNEAGVYVKAGSFFEVQGGLTETWGKDWERVEAKTLHEARAIGIGLRRDRFPESCKTIGEDEPMESAWPEAMGVEV